MNSETMNSETMNSDQYKEHIVQLLADIKELKQDNIIMENKIQEIRIYYITNKDKLCDKNNWTPTEPMTNKTNVMHDAFKSYLRDLSNLIANENMTIKDNVRKLENFILEVYYNDKLNDKYLTENWKKMFNFVEDELITRILINDKKLEYYENFLKLYPVSKSKSDNDKKLEYYENFMKLYPVSMSVYVSVSESESESKCEKPVIEKKQFSVSASVIFIIMIVFYVITVTTVVLVVNHNHNYNTATMQDICSKND
jgi:hypothetical protein